MVQIYAATLRTLGWSPGAAAPRRAGLDGGLQLPGDPADPEQPSADSFLPGCFPTGQVVVVVRSSR